MNESQSVESTARQPVCAKCGSQLSSTDGTESCCVNCLLRAAMGDEDFEDAGSPHRFDQYELITDDQGNPVELGRGAMGVTYKAFDTNLRCEVALKVIHPRFLADESSRARFLSEARAAAQLRHRNIASVFHLGGSEHGGYFYTMELVEGETIENLVRHKGPIDCATALDITLQITRALIAAGDRKFVHRDIKPSNIMLCTEADGAIVAKLIDFGLVRGITEKFAPTTASPAREQANWPNPSSGRSSEVALTPVRTGFIGTPHFASPEQFAGERTDARSDIYSLGVTLWFMLSGKLPFDGARDDIHQKQLSGALPLDQLKGIPRPVIDLITRMLDPDSAKRPQSSVVLKEQLYKCVTAIDAAEQKRHRRLKYSALAATALVITALGGSYIFQRKLVPNSASQGVPEKTIAVLPFENLNADQDSDFFTHGVQDEILTALARIADLKVISRTSVMEYKSGIARDLGEIGQQLGVAYVVEGSVQRSANRVRVNAQLVNARTEGHVWAQSYDRDLKDVFAIQSDIAKAIANQLQAKLSASEQTAIAQAPTKDLAAFLLYARAKNLLSSIVFTNPTTPTQKLLQAVDLLNQAVARDPSFFLAYCRLAHTHDLIYFLGNDHTPTRLALAEAATRVAFQLRPTAGEVHVARGENLYWGHLDFDHALAELEIASSTLPNDPRIFELNGFIQRRQGKYEEGLNNLERALGLDPRNLDTLQEIATTDAIMRRYSEEAVVLDRCLTIAPNDIDTRVVRAQLDLNWKADTRPLRETVDSIRAENPNAASAIADSLLMCALAEGDASAAETALQALGENTFTNFDQIPVDRSVGAGLVARMAKDEAKARAAFGAARLEQERRLQMQPNYAPAIAVLGLIDAGLGRKDEALREGRHAVELLPVEKDAIKGTQVIKYLAIIAAWTGEKDLASEQLAIAAKLPGYLSYGQLKLLPWWDPLRGDPRFEKIVASLAPQASGAAPEKSIAVLPFESLGGDKEQAFFADGVQDDVLTKLAKVADLKVISRTSVLQYRGKQDPREIGRALGVSHVLEGTVRPYNKKVHVNARLVDTRTDADVWGEEYDRDSKEIFAIEAELAQAVANQLRANVSARETLTMQESPTRDLVAYDLYVHAKNLVMASTFGDKASGDDLLQAADLLNQAVTHDPFFFQAFCQLAAVHDRIYLRAWDHTPGRLALAEAALQAASRLRRDAGETRFARAQNLYAGYLDYDGALAELEVARKSLPNNAQILQLMGYIQRRQGQWEASTRNLERSVELNPRDLETLQQIAINYDLFRRYPEEASVWDRALAVEPNNVETKVVRALLDFGWKADIRPLHYVIQEIRVRNPNSVKDIASEWLICALAERDAAGAKDALIAGGETPFTDIPTSRQFVEGLIARMTKDEDKARAAFTTARAEQEKVIQAEPSFGPSWCVLGLIDAALGQNEKALYDGRRAVELCPVERDAIRGPMMIEYLAMIAAWIGDKDLACENLAVAAEPPSWVDYGELKLLPWWDPLRGDPRFEKIVASLAPK